MGGSPLGRGAAGAMACWARDAGVGLTVKFEQKTMGRKDVFINHKKFKDQKAAITGTSWIRSRRSTPRIPSVLGCRRRKEDEAAIANNSTPYTSTSKEKKQPKDETTCGSLHPRPPSSFLRLHDDACKGVLHQYIEK